MMRFVLTPGHEYTFDALRDRKKKVRDLPIELWTYRRLAAAKALPPGTWVFTDLERLAVWELRLAGEAARLLRAAGCRVLNDPARAACRYELLFRLHAAGFNRFRAWRAEDGIPAARFPVFLRLESNHGMPVSGLVETAEALRAELDRLAELGVSRRGVLIVEYEAEALEPGVFRKYGAYRFGDRIVADHLVHDVTWLAKYGHDDAWTAERYADEAAYVRDNPHRDVLMRAFEIAGIDYGRADYGVVGGRVQLWEINTNPYLPAGDVTKASPLRAEATLAARESRLDAIAALETPGEGAPVTMDSDLLKAHRARQNWRRRDMIRD